MTTKRAHLFLFAALPVLCFALAGCKSCGCLPAAHVPRELDKTTLPDHIIEPPDILLITGVRLIAKPPYRIEPLDGLYIRVANAPPEDPIDAVYSVDPDGRIVLSPGYGAVSVSGKTTEEARAVIEELLKGKIVKPQIFISLVQSRALQQVAGEHLVQPNGKVDLGTYGSVQVTGMTTEEARAAIEAHLSNHLIDPQVSVSIAAYNSKVYYIITDGAGFGEQVYRFPTTGGETVLDAMSQINGLPAVSSRKRIWLARPGLDDEPEQVLPIDWKAITRGARTSTNYQVLPGDRIYVQSSPLVAAEIALSRIIAPVERLFGISLLGNAVVEGFKPGLSNSGQ